MYPGRLTFLFQVNNSNLTETSWSSQKNQHLQRWVGDGSLHVSLWKGLPKRRISLQTTIVLLLYILESINKLGLNTSVYSPRTSTAVSELLPVFTTQPSQYPAPPGLGLEQFTWFPVGSKMIMDRAQESKGQIQQKDTSRKVKEKKGKSNTPCYIKILVRYQLSPPILLWGVLF